MKNIKNLTFFIICCILTEIYSVRYNFHQIENSNRTNRLLVYQLNNLTTDYIQYVYYLSTCNSESVEILATNNLVSANHSIMYFNQTVCPFARIVNKFIFFHFNYPKNIIVTYDLNYFIIDAVGTMVYEKFDRLIDAVYIIVFIIICMSAFMGILIMIFRCYMEIKMKTKDNENHVYYEEIK